MKKAIIIGSGIAGIASALRLRKKGFQVKVFEAQEKLGGKIQELRTNSYRWDKGPSLFTMPHLIEELFHLYDENPADHFNYIRCEEICRYFWEDGTQFIAHSNQSQFIAEAAKIFDEDSSGIQSYLNKSEKKYNTTAGLFIEKSLHNIKNYFSTEAWRAFRSIPQLDLFSTLNDVNSNHFKSEKLIQLFNRFATYNGSSPYKTPGIMSMIPHLEMGIGTFYPIGGMRSIIESLTDLAKRNGISFHYPEAIESICHKAGRVSGVRSSKAFYDAELVVSNADINFTYQNLLPDLKAPKQLKSQEMSSSGIIFYWGIKKSFKNLDLHNIFFSQDYKREFEQIFDEKVLPNDPTIYVNISSKKDMNDAPNGCENWFVMINTPNNTGQDWAAYVEIARKRILEKLSRLLGEEIEPLIDSEHFLDPVKIESQTSSFKGSLYGSSSNSKYAAFLRHPNFHSKTQGLYFSGGSVHPGGGIPLCLNSAKIIANQV